MQPNTLLRISPLALALLLGSVAGYARADPPDNVDPPECSKRKIHAQHFCCAETFNKNGAKSGSDCETIDKGDVKTCTLAGGAVLYCPGAWDLNTSGTATC